MTVVKMSRFSRMLNEAVKSKRPWRRRWLWAICRGGRTSGRSGCAGGSRDEERPGESSGMGTGDGNTERHDEITTVRISDTTILLDKRFRKQGGTVASFRMISLQIGTLWMKGAVCVLEIDLRSGNLDRHWRCGQQSGSRRMHGRRMHRP